MHIFQNSKHYNSYADTSQVNACVGHEDSVVEKRQMCKEQPGKSLYTYTKPSGKN